MKFEPRHFDLKEIIENNIWLFSQSAANKEITLQNKVNSSIPVFADINMVSIVIRNLTSNAIKFTPIQGQVTIFVNDYKDKAHENSDAISVSVRDTGIGIAPQNQAKLFKIDEYHTTPGTDDEKGTGLGLIIVKEMVERNGGQIWVESEPNKGTTFHFTVPYSG